jgi:hypothetical protein
MVVVVVVVVMELVMPLSPYANHLAPCLPRPPHALDPHSGAAPHKSPPPPRSTALLGPRLVAEAGDCVLVQTALGLRDLELAASRPEPVDFPLEARQLHLSLLGRQGETERDTRVGERGAVQRDGGVA